MAAGAPLFGNHSTAESAKPTHCQLQKVDKPALKPRQCSGKCQLWSLLKLDWGMSLNGGAVLKGPWRNLETLPPSAQVNLQFQQCSPLFGRTPGRQANFGLSWGCKLTAMKMEAKIKLKFRAFKASLLLAGVGSQIPPGPRDSLGSGFFWNYGL